MVLLPPHALQNRAQTQSPQTPHPLEKLFSLEYQFLSNTINCTCFFQVLLEGSPGVGKTSLIVALGKFSGHHVVRINLSEQVCLS